MIGQTLGSYRIVEQVGIGGMATVYKAYDPGTDRYVAIKILPAHYSQDPTFRERFRREAKAIARLEHPHILPIHAYGEEGDTAYLLMRFLPTGTLKQRIERGSLPYGEASAMLTQIADGLDYAHKRGILHRDIKPSNILLDESGNAYLSDFGIARMIGSAGDLTGTGMLGTPAYMSPEQCAGSRDLSPASDQYALGVVLYEMVTGRTPFQAETPLALIQMHLSAPLPPPHLLRPDLPESVEGVILKALSRNPQDRWANCGEMADAFNRAIGESGLAAYSPPMRSGETTAEGLELTFGETMPAPPPTAKAARRSVPVWMLGLAGVVVIGLIIGGLAIAGVLGTQVAASGSPASNHEATLTMSAGTAQSMAGTASIQLTNQATQGSSGTTGTPSASITPTILEQGEILSLCSGDICIDNSPLGLANTYYSFFDISWSPDGSKIAFTACLLADLQANPLRQCEGNLYVANRDGSNVLPLDIDPASYIRLVSWSPDGQWIAYEWNNQINLIRPDGTGERVLVSNRSTCMSGFEWSPDSKRLAWMDDHCTQGEGHRPNMLLVIDINSGQAKVIWDAADPRFAIGSLAWSPDGNSVAVSLQNGVSYLVDANCDALPTGCDEFSRMQLDSFSEHWMHTFYPQWAGEPELEAVKLGCQPGDNVLYAEDFEGEESAQQFGSWQIEEAPGGGKALHAKGEANYSLVDAPIQALRTKFRVYTVNGSWSFAFRNSDSDNAFYTVDVKAGSLSRLDLTLMSNSTFYSLGQAGFFSQGQWATIEIDWENSNTIVVRQNGVEAIRYVETGPVIEQGAVRIWIASAPIVDQESWFDDIVICGL